MRDSAAGSQRSGSSSRQQERGPRTNVDRCHELVLGHVQERYALLAGVRADRIDDDVDSSAALHDLVDERDHRCRIRRVRDDVLRRPPVGGDCFGSGPQLRLGTGAENHGSAGGGKLSSDRSADGAAASDDDGDLVREHVYLLIR